MFVLQLAPPVAPLEAVTALPAMLIVLTALTALAVNVPLKVPLAALKAPLNVAAPLTIENLGA